MLYKKYIKWKSLDLLDGNSMFQIELFNFYVCHLSIFCTISLFIGTKKKYLLKTFSLLLSILFYFSINVIKCQQKVFKLLNCGWEKVSFFCSIFEVSVFWGNSSLKIGLNEFCWWYDISFHISYVVSITIFRKQFYWFDSFLDNAK